MKFLLDAQLPVFLCHWLTDQGFPSIHTSFLPNKNRSSDEQVLAVVEKDERVLISKDGDFYESFLVNGRPKKLLLVTTGNISNQDLKKLFERNINQVAQLFKSNNLIELNRDRIIVHE